MAMLKAMKTSSYRSTLHEKYKLHGPLIEPVKAVGNSVLSHNSPVSKHQRGGQSSHESLLYKMLNKERQHAHYLFTQSSSDTEKLIKDLITTYNDIVKVIIAIEEEVDYQVDQNLQHTLISHRLTLEKFGIGIRQSLYLEYNTINLRKALSQTSPDEIYFEITGPQGVFMVLYKAIDRLVDKLIDLDGIVFEDQSHIIDQRA